MQHCFASHSRMAEVSGVSVSTVKRFLKKLRTKNLIDWTRVSRGSCTYNIKPEGEWKLTDLIAHHDLSDSSHRPVDSSQGPSDRSHRASDRSPWPTINTKSNTKSNTNSIKNNSSNNESWIGQEVFTSLTNLKNIEPGQIYVVSEETHKDIILEGIDQLFNKSDFQVVTTEQENLSSVEDF